MSLKIILDSGNIKLFSLRVTDSLLNKQHIITRMSLEERNFHYLNQLTKYKNQYEHPKMLSIQPMQRVTI